MTLPFLYNFPFKKFRESELEVTVYIVQCSDRSYYTGLTKQEIDARIWEHNVGIYRGYTFTRRPVRLVFMEVYDRMDEAVTHERQIKGWSRHKKEALIALNYCGLPELSKRGPADCC